MQGNRRKPFLGIKTSGCLRISRLSLTAMGSESWSLCQCREERRLSWKGSKGNCLPWYSPSAVPSSICCWLSLVQMQRNIWVRWEINKMPHLILYWMGTRDYQIFTQHHFYRGGGERRLLDCCPLVLPSVVCTSNCGCPTNACKCLTKNAASLQ